MTGFALFGFDPVAYRLEGAARRGDPEIFLDWGGARFVFEKRANRAAFAADPLVYAPLFGGFDALAMAKGRAVAPDPAVYLITPSGVVLFRTDANRAAFQSRPEAMQEAIAAWRALAFDNTPS